MYFYTILHIGGPHPEFWISFAKSQLFGVKCELNSSHSRKYHTYLYFQKETAKNNSIYY
jgi:hypothetical protein